VRAVGVLSIDARRIGDRLRLTVRDNGPGFEGADGPLEATAPAGAGYGLWNIRARLQGYFGDRAAFSISRDAPGAATVASIELPLVTQAVPR
jgi:sensor histidine kinase YesM